MIVAQVNRAAFKAYFEEYNEYPEGTDAYENQNYLLGGHVNE